MFKVLIFMGTRPEIIKLAPIIRRMENDNELDLILVHSGQHYDKEMSDVFLEQLNIKKLDDNLNVGSGSQGIQTAKMIEGYELSIKKYAPDIVLAQGDTNSVVAASIVCAKLSIPFGHIEAGIRSFDMSMPEEINRKIANVTTALNFAPTKQAVLNLYYEGIDPDRIFQVGNTVVDATLDHSKIAKEKSTILNDLKLDSNKPIITLTFHRAANVDEKTKLEAVCNTICSLSNYTIIFPVHPRTEKRLKEFNLRTKLEQCENIILLKPLDYLNMLRLMMESKIILTDSGGLQEEAITLRKPCITLRTNTERPETVNLGVNFLVGTDSEKLLAAIETIEKSEELARKLLTVENPYGDGTASEKIVAILKSKLKADNIRFKAPLFFKKGSLNYKLIVLTKDSTKTRLESEHNGRITLMYDEQGHPVEIQEKIQKNWKIRMQY